MTWAKVLSCESDLLVEKPIVRIIEEVLEHTTSEGG